MLYNLKINVNDVDYGKMMEFFLLHFIATKYINSIYFFNFNVL